MMSYGSETFFGGSDNVLEWDKPQCIYKYEKKIFLNDPNGGGTRKNVVIKSRFIIFKRSVLKKLNHCKMLEIPIT